MLSLCCLPARLHHARVCCYSMMAITPCRGPPKVSAHWTRSWQAPTATWHSTKIQKVVQTPKHCKTKFNVPCTCLGCDPVLTALTAGVNLVREIKPATSFTTIVTELDSLHQLHQVLLEGIHYIHIHQPHGLYTCMHYSYASAMTGYYLLNWHALINGCSERAVPLRSLQELSHSGLYKSCPMRKSCQFSQFVPSPGKLPFALCQI